jgi:hypothetical protein
MTLKIMKISLSARDEKKIEPQSTRRPQSVFFKKAKNKTNFMNVSSSLRPLGSPRLMALFSLWGIKIFLSLDPPRMKAKG